MPREKKDLKLSILKPLILDKELNVLLLEKTQDINRYVIIFYDDQFVVMYYDAFCNLIRLDMPKWAKSDRRDGDTSSANVSMTKILGTKTACHFEEGVAEQGSDLGGWYYNDIEIVGFNFANQRMVLRIRVKKYKKLRKIVLA